MNLAPSYPSLPPSFVLLDLVSGILSFASEACIICNQGQVCLFLYHMALSLGVSPWEIACASLMSPVCYLSPCPWKVKSRDSEQILVWHLGQFPAGSVFSLRLRASKPVKGIWQTLFAFKGCIHSHIYSNVHSEVAHTTVNKQMFPSLQKNSLVSPSSGSPWSRPH